LAHSPEIGRPVGGGKRERVIGKGTTSERQHNQAMQ
jgi:hypothetical protein